MNSANFDKYKVQHLFLLIGTNPLPNYIAARQLLTDGGTAYLVYTSETKCWKDRLLDRLRSRKIKITEIYLDKSESDSNHIHKKIYDKVSSIPEAEKVGLNYTGGTKAMSVHAYRAVYDKRGHKETFYSYLDPRKLQMYIDQDNGEPFHDKVQIEISMRELLDLHYLEWQPKPLDEPKLPEASSEIVELYKNDDLAIAWKKWCKEKLHPLTKNGEYWKEETELALREIVISIDSLPVEFRRLLKKHLNASENQLSIQVSKEKGFDSLQQVCEWLSFIWLEHYVLAQVKGISKSKMIHESKMSLHVKERNSSRKGDKFEFDVAFMRNYQLFAISCTTSSDPKRCKQKLFEAAIRARQLGGDEARVALVCYSSEPDKIKNQLKVTLPDRKVDVFGIDDLSDLSDEISSWIERNERDSK
ncbi:MAG: DUF1887 family protein [Pseudanabaena sp. M158S2SP1A06QC]|jgi:hypothetical protein|nr:DUF1887 family protein [Pseudanabaena sp. M158S2SP1A06QC]MCA6624599.1 DUF1887 family protein [Pseudanabaena sp. M165S2SP1A06QC]